VAACGQPLTWSSRSSAIRSSMGAKGPAEYHRTALGDVRTKWAKVINDILVTEHPRLLQRIAVTSAGSSNASARRRPMGVCVSSMPSTALVALQCARLASGSWAIAQRRAGCEPRSLKRWPAAKCTASSRRCSIRDDLAQIQARGPAICACFQRPHRCLHQSNGDESALSVAAKQLTKPYSLMPMRPSSACASAIAAKDCSTLTANASQLCAWCRGDVRQI